LQVAERERINRNVSRDRRYRLVVHPARELELAQKPPQ